MKKLFIFCSALLAALAGCNNDVTSDVMSSNSDGSIAFNAFVPKSSRGSDVTVDTLKITGFNVFAYKANIGNYDSPFIDNVKFSYVNGKGWISTPVYYWPSYPLDFFCYYPDVVESGTKTPESFSYTVAPEAKDQVDVLMTYAEGKTQSAENNPLELAFHHALSKINFVIQTKSGSGLNVTVDTISIENVNMKGTIAYNLKATEMPFFTYSEVTNLGSPINTLEPSINLTAAATGDPVASSGPITGMYLLPQTLTNWKYDDTNAYPLKGTYINIKGALTGVTDYTGDIAIPIQTEEWKPGYSYTYTIVFGGGGSTGGGGYNPNTSDGSIPEKPQQILVPIIINVTVDEWQDITPPIDIPL